MPVFYPDHVVNGSQQSSDAATFTHRLPRRGCLSSILLKAACTNGATSGRGVNIHNVVDQIQVIGDGSYVLYNAFPQEIEKMQEILLGHPFPIEESQAASAVQRGTYQINFGRYMEDPEFYLPLGAFNDVELRVTFSPTIAADAGFTTQTTTFDVILVWLSEPLPSYLGTLVTKSTVNFTSAASGIDSRELNRGFPLRFVNVFAYEAAIEDGVDITHIQISRDNQTFDFIDMDWLEAIDYQQVSFGLYVPHRARLLLTNNESWASRIGRINSVSIHERTAVDTTGDVLIAARADTIAGDTLTFDIGNVDVTAGSETITASSADSAIDIEVSGQGVGYDYLHVFGDLFVPDTWLDTSQVSRLDLDLTQAAAGATVRVATQEAHFLADRIAA